MANIMDFIKKNWIPILAGIIILLMIGLFAPKYTRAMRSELEAEKEAKPQNGGSC